MSRLPRQAGWEGQPLDHRLAQPVAVALGASSEKTRYMATEQSSTNAVNTAPLIDHLPHRESSQVVGLLKRFQVVDRGPDFAGVVRPERNQLRDGARLCRVMTKRSPACTRFRSRGRCVFASNAPISGM